jgi:hypothetical protein
MIFCLKVIATYLAGFFLFPISWLMEQRQAVKYAYLDSIKPAHEVVKREYAARKQRRK